jgi:hypothetical protein
MQNKICTKCKQDLPISCFTKGPDNIQVISRKANTMKNNATKEQLISFAKGVLEVHSKEVGCDVISS